MNQVSRRDFVKQGGAFLAATSLVSLAGCSKRESQANASIPLGVQLYSVRTEAENDLPGTLQKIAKMGYDGVEFAGFYGHSATEIKQWLDNNGLQSCGSHTQLTALSPENFEATVEFNKTLGNKYLVVPWLPEEMRSDWKQIADKFNELSEQLKPHGMLVGYHNHDFEFQPVNGQIPWDIFAQNTHPEVILQLDTGNCMHGGADALETLKRYPGRAITVHLKEYSASNPNAIIGEGDVPWQEVLNFCETKGGTEWYIIEEEKDVYPPLVAIEKSYNNFQALKA